MKHEELEQLLRQLGEMPVEAPDELTVARMERRWRTAAGVPRPRISRRRAAEPAWGRRPLVVAGFVAAAAAIGVGLVVAARDPQGSDVVVAEARGITVVLPSGEVISPLAGEALPEGAIIESSSAVRIGSELLTPGTRYIVENGLLRPEGSPATSDPPEGDSAAVVSATTRPSSNLKPSAGPSTSTSVPGPSSSAAPTSTAGPSTTKKPRPTLPPRRPPAHLSIGVSRNAKQARITWAPYTGAKVKRYVVIRVRSWNGSSLPKGKRIASISKGKATVALDRSPVDGTYYVVAALGDHNTLLAIGSVATPHAPATTTTVKTPNHKK